MKKLLFGLLLTVGVSGFSLGNTRAIEEIEIKSQKKYNNIFEDVFACYTQVVTDHYDSNGNYTGTTTDPWQESVCHGQSDGSRFTVYTEKHEPKKPVTTMF